MNLKEIKNYSNYSLDLDTNNVYNTKFNRILSIGNRNKYNYVKLYKNGKFKLFQLHRLIYEAHFGNIPEGLLIDHIDNNRQNNNISNLRLATHSENTCNNSKTNSNTGYKNITFCKKYNKYRVAIKKNNKTVYNKNFKTLEEAIENRNIQLKEIHGEFHNLG
jgi:hypothetical protein